MAKLRVFEAFSGIGTQTMGLSRANIDHDVVAISEIDTYAIRSYEAIHGSVNNLGDISQIDTKTIPDHDLFTYSFPCQSISVAGLQHGLDPNSGTRSSLLWECQKVIDIKRPKYLLMENVKNLVGKTHKHNFDLWLEWLESKGYTNYWKVLNSKDYGVPQNRERVFVVSIFGKHEPYEFPEAKPLDKTLKDVLLQDVEDPDGIPFVVQSNKNNMVKMKADKQWLLDNDEPVVEGNAIVLGVTLPVVSYQPYEFGASQVITARSEHLNELRGLFIASVINLFVIPKYSYVYKPGIQKYKQDVIPLPLKPSANPSNYTQEDIDWTYMDTVMSRVTARAKDRLANLPQPTDKKKTPVDTSAWGVFVVGELFDVHPTKAYKLKNSDLLSTNGKNPVVVNSSYNNGIGGYTDQELTEAGNILTFSDTTSGADTLFFQEKPFVGYSHVQGMYPKTFELTIDVAKFMIASLRASINKYSWDYTNKLTRTFISSTTIKLPLKPSADPSNYSQDDIDWDYMDRFMQAIEEKAHERVASLKEQI